MNEEPEDEGADPRLGTTLNERYRIVKRIGAGGMGVVYEGLHLIIKRRVAIKMLHAYYMKNPEIRARFRREAIAATTIRHPHIVEVLDMGQLPDGAAYMVLEFLDGRDWAFDIERDGPQPLGRAVRILRQVCDGLQAAHDNQIVHRDLKPENVFLAQHGSDPDFVKIVDFGISKILSEPETGSGDRAHNLTKTGAAMGTPYAMSPEQMHGLKDIDHRADIWALGVMLYRALTGAYPFDAESFPLLAIKLVTGEPAPLSQYRSDLPPQIQTIVSRLLDKNRATRFQNARDVRDALAPFESVETAPALAREVSIGMAATMTPATPGAPLLDPPKLTSLGHRVTPPEPPSAIAATPPLGSPKADAPPSGSVPLDTSTPSAVRTLEATSPAATPQGAGVWTGAILAVVLIGLGVGGTVVGLRMFGGDPPPSSAIDAPPPPTTTVPPSTVDTARPPPPPGTGPTVRVQITTTPASAELFLDGNPIPNPFDADLPASTERHTIEVRAEGFTTDTREVSLAFPMRVAIELDREGAARPHHDGPPATHAHGETPPPTATTTTHVESTHVETPPPTTAAPPPPPPPTSEATPTDRHHGGLANPFGR